MTIFEKPGKQNTGATVKLALNTARERGIRSIVVASYTGYTADYFKTAPDLNIVAVRGTYGFGEMNTIRMSGEKYEELSACGIKIVTAAHVLSGVERAMSTLFKGVYPVEVIAHTLRMFGQGTKVCIECAAMACDCGAIPAGEPTIAVAGTGAGADTAIILKPVNTHRIFDTRICEMLCKPALLT
ncbi:MAG: hypothetical protein GX111_11685 [Clostridiales bacterium]|nr:hypothetical protein [Clostridiales bacterium]